MSRPPIQCIAGVAIGCLTNFGSFRHNPASFRTEAGRAAARVPGYYVLPKNAITRLFYILIGQAGPRLFSSSGNAVVCRKIALWLNRVLYHVPFINKRAF